jgi:photosystem II PsbT protein
LTGQFASSTIYPNRKIFAMESVAYILILALAIGVLFFAIAFREPPRIGK